MSDRVTDIIGEEGLGITVAAVAQQISAIEKAMTQQFASLAQAVEMQAEGIRRETASEAARLNTLLQENAEKSNLRVDALRQEMDLHVEALHREIAAARDTSMMDAGFSAVRGEIKSVGDVAAERMARFMEVKELHWDEHKETHKQEDEAIRVAYTGLDKRLDSMNEFRAQISDMTATFATKDTVDRSVGNLEARVERNEVDARRRDELKEAKINDLEKQLGREFRAEVRPVQDARVGQAAIVAAFLIGLTIIGVIIAVANFATGP